MLPIPSTAYRTRPRNSQSYFVSGPSALPNSVFERLRTRARLTNLAVGLILSLLGFSLIVNLRYYPTDRLRIPHSSARAQAYGSTSKTTSIASIENTIERTEEIKGLDHLVMVAGHAIWKGSDPESRTNDTEWILTPVQKGGSVKTFYKHIEAG